jgi:two-component system cell cycle response regulator
MLTGLNKLEPGAEAKTVLVVEDNELNMKLVRTLLQVGNYRVLCAENAGTGIRLAEEHLPDLILMDIQLPDMDGLAATRQIKNDPKTRGIPVVALTAYAMEKDRRMAMEAGCVDHMTKPINTKAFLSSVSRYVSGDQKETFPPAPVGTPLVLVVDDEPMNIKLLETMLKMEDFSTVSASNGSEALESVKRKKPDLILMDVMMPGVGGFDVTRQLKADPKTRKIPIVLVTALGSPDDKFQGMAAGADEFLNKPVNRVELIARVKSLLNLKAYREQLSCRLKSEKKAMNFDGTNLPVDDQSPVASILLVEDNPKDMDLLKLYLADQPYRFVGARTGEKAIAICRREPVDLVLLDLMLPDLDGFDVCRQLRADDRTRNIQILMVSSQNDLDSKLKGLDLGADEFLTKPINREELVIRTRALLKKKHYLDRLLSRLETALSVSITDGLTELYNCFYLKHFMEIEIKRCGRQQQSMAFIMIDIDDFKEYNDTYGHPAGDFLLKHFGRLIKKTVRDVDLAARYGGEEFGVVLPYTNKKDALIAAERLLNAIRNCTLPEDSYRPCEGKTASMGIACYPDDGTTAAEIVKHADEALYQAKRQGKNRISVYSAGRESADA